MQNLDNQIWKSRIAVSTKLKLYNYCILPIFLYSSECWSVTKRDVLKIDALDQWCLRKLLRIKFPSSAERRVEMENRATTPVGYCPSTASFPVWPHCTDDKWNRCQEDHNSFTFGELEETTRTSSYYMDEDYTARPENNLSLDEALLWLRSVHSGDWCLRSPSGACHTRRRRR